MESLRDRIERGDYDVSSESVAAAIWSATSQAVDAFAVYDE
jgi:anti-sigma28 factor (negative regulator of flagellin synthesis)